MEKQNKSRSDSSIRPGRILQEQRIKRGYTQDSADKINNVSLVASPPKSPKPPPKR